MAIVIDYSLPVEIPEEANEENSATDEVASDIDVTNKDE